jgi:hypothetical protein
MTLFWYTGILSTYWYVPVCTIKPGMYWYVPGTYWYVPVLYRYVLNTLFLYNWSRFQMLDIYCIMAYWTYSAYLHISHLLHILHIPCFNTIYGQDADSCQAQKWWGAYGDHHFRVSHSSWFWKIPLENPAFLELTKASTYLHQTVTSWHILHIAHSKMQSIQNMDGELFFCILFCTWSIFFLHILAWFQVCILFHIFCIFCIWQYAKYSVTCKICRIWTVNYFFCTLFCTWTSPYPGIYRYILSYTEFNGVCTMLVYNSG